ncbi:hypothetical protein F511_07161 [Dorcoceras hygrometricum]|nr:hypothetical protein F511_07161 [Dorcoceras hygrometricum]
MNKPALLGLLWTMGKMMMKMRRQEFVIVNNVDAYDDVKITCHPIPKESWRKIHAVKEETNWEGNRLGYKLRAQQRPRAGKNRTKAAEYKNR